jgi:hypothetical protein
MDRPFQRSAGFPRLLPLHNVLAYMPKANHPMLTSSLRTLIARPDREVTRQRLGKLA